VCLVVCDGLKGLPEAIAAVWPAAITKACMVRYADLRIMPMGWRDPLLDRGFVLARSA
jgi:transposase-like protein